MKKNKIHIDQLFKRGLKNLSFLVSNKDLEHIEQKKSVFDEQDTNSTSFFNDFEIPIDNSDWIKTQQKLKHEKRIIQDTNKIALKFNDFELPVLSKDWSETYKKLQKSKKKKVLWWWTKVGVLAILLGFSLIGFIKTNFDSKQNESSFSNKQNSNESILNNNNPSPNLNTKHQMPQIENNSSNKELLGQNETELKNNLNSNVKKPSNQTAIESTLLEQNGENFGVQPQETLTFNPKVIQFKPFQSKFIFDNIEKIEQIAVVLPKTNLKVLKFYIGLNNSVLNHQYVLNKNNNADFNAINRSAKTNHFAWNKGLVLGYILNKSRFELGLNQSKFNINTNIQYKTRVFDSIPVRNVNGNIIGYFLARGRDSMINENSQLERSIFQINLQYKKLFKIEKNLNLIAGIGSNINYQYQSKGNLALNPLTNKVSDYQKIKQNERHLLFAPQVNLGLQYQFKNNFCIETNALSTVSIQNLYQENINQKIKPLQYGLELKLLYLIK